MHNNCVDNKVDNTKDSRVKGNICGIITIPIESRIKDTKSYTRVKKIIDSGRRNRVTNTLINGVASGLKTTWMLTKIIVPVYFIITVLGHTFILDWISSVFAPVMQYLGLPGEAAMVLVLGNTINLYAAVATIATLSLTTKQITILAVMLSFSHSLFMETAVAKKTGISASIVLLIRFTLAILSGIVLNQLL